MGDNSFLSRVGYEINILYNKFKFLIKVIAIASGYILKAEEECSL